MTKLRVKTENKSNMKCREAELQIIDILAQQSSAGMPEELAGHLASCSSCNELLQEYGSGFNALASGRRKVADSGFYDRLTTKLQAEDSSQANKVRPLIRIQHFSPLLTATAASLILGIWLGGRMFNSFQTGIENGNTLTGQERIVLLDAWASDLNLNDDATLALENYLMDDETPDANDTK